MAEHRSDGMQDEFFSRLEKAIESGTEAIEKKYDKAEKTINNGRQKIINTLQKEINIKDKALQAVVNNVEVSITDTAAKKSIDKARKALNNGFDEMVLEISPQVKVNLKPFVNKGKNNGISHISNQVKKFYDEIVVDYDYSDGKEKEKIHYPINRSANQKFVGYYTRAKADGIVFPQKIAEEYEKTLQLMIADEKEYQQIINETKNIYAEKVKEKHKEDEARQARKKEAQEKKDELIETTRALDKQIQKTNELEKELDKVSAKLSETTARLEELHSTEKVNINFEDALSDSATGLKHKLLTIKEIAQAYDKIISIEDKMNETDEDTKKYEKLESDLESAEGVIRDFESAYSRVLIQLTDGSKLDIPLDEEFSETIESILSDMSKIADVTLVSPDLQKAIDGYEILGKVLDRNIAKSGNKAGTIKPGDVLESTRAFNELESCAQEISRIENAIQSIQAQDPDGIFGDLSQLEKAENLLTVLRRRIEEIPRENSFIDLSEGLFDEADWDKFQPDFDKMFEQVKIGAISAEDAVELLLQTMHNLSQPEISQSSLEEEKEEFQEVATATTEAAQAKKEFATANEGVQASVNGSKSKLEFEAELMESIAKNAREAAKAKKEFAEANKQVQDSVDKTSGKLNNDSQKSDDEKEKESIEKLDGAAIRQTGLLTQNDAGTYVIEKGAQRQMVKWETGDDGEIIEEPQLVTTDFKKLAKEIIRADEQLTKLETTLERNNKLYGKFYDTAPIDACIKSVKSYIELLEAEAKIYADEDDYLTKFDKLKSEREEAKKSIKNKLESGYAEQDARKAKAKADKDAKQAKKDTDKVTKDADKAIQDKYKQNYKIIEDYIKAGNELNRLQTKRVKDSDFSNSSVLSQNIQKQVKLFTALKKEANDALKIIQELYESDSINLSQLNSAQNLMEEPFAATLSEYREALNTKMSEHWQEIQKIEQAYNELGLTSDEVQQKLKELYDANAKVQSSAKEHVTERRQNELAYQEVLKRTQDILEQDQKVYKETKSQYNEALKILNQYRSKSEKYNSKLEERVQKGFSNEELRQELNDIDSELKQIKKSAMEALDEINRLYDSGLISREQQRQAHDIYTNATDTEHLKAVLDDKSIKNEAEVKKLHKQYSSLGIEIKEVAKALEKLQDAQNNVVKMENATAEKRIEAEELYQQTLAETKKILNDNLPLYKAMYGEKVGNFSDEETARQRAIEHAKNIGKIVKDLQYSDIPKNDIFSFVTEIETASGEIKKLSYNWNKATGDMVVSTKMLRTELKGFPGLIQTIGNKIKQLSVYWFANMFNPMDFIQYGRTWLNFAQQYDDALTSMQKVTDDTKSTLQDFQKESYQLADAVGTTAQQLQNSTVDFLRLGEALDEAKQSAQEANILFNVSEFGTIDEATSSLVSMSQAYSELEKRQIIDKLNIVGNNYAISTEELALALQNSASALKVAGNDINEAIALATTANTIVQDYSKVSAGIRTVSMRITGATAEELQEAGEDVDGLVETTAKLEKLVKSLTAINGNKGISLLDDNGNFRSTYEILLDIARIWKEIGEQDKLDGNNRQNVLLESLAGKNRASILAAILDSPEILEAAYNSSAFDSEGSAQEELNKQLESISGHIAKLQNQWQNLWAETANRDVINFFLDLATAILKVADNIGVIQTLLIGGTGIFTAIKGNGRLKMSSLIFMFKYAVSNKCPHGYVSFLIAVCEIHK